MNQRQDEKFEALADSLADYLKDQFERSPKLKQLVRQLAKLVLETIDQPATTEAIEHGESQTRDQEDLDATSQAAEPAPVPSGPRAVVPLAIGDAQPVEVEVRGSAEHVLSAMQAVDQKQAGKEQPVSSGDEIDLSLIYERSRLKAQSCRQYIERRKCLPDSPEEKEQIDRMHAMIDKAKSLPECFLWVFWQYEDQPDDDLLFTIADCYDALAEAVDLCSSVLSCSDAGSSDRIRKAFQYLAQASSALRVALGKTWVVKKPDQDQEQAHHWLANETFTRQVYVQHYMKLDDPADPDQAPELRECIKTLADEIAQVRANEMRVVELFNKAEYHADKLAGDEPENLHHWNTINGCLSDIESLGVQKDHPRLLTLIGQLNASQYPEGVSPHPLLRSGGAPLMESKPQPEPLLSESILEVRRWIQNKAIVIVGGEQRSEASERIRSAFDLAEVNWVELTEHGSSKRLKPAIFRDNVVLVVALIKLAGHQHVEDARKYAKEAGKPFIALTAGYNPEQIAQAVKEQASQRLQEQCSEKG